MKDTKLRVLFTVVYKSGKIRQGTMYAEGNIKMVDGELIARLDQLYSKETVAILFPPRAKDYQISQEKLSAEEKAAFFKEHGIVIEINNERQ
ncbi:hypothetical protein F4212_01305 [Candidatus Poribacteria bacterium]|nr:hypothetical protein [Candidatus Poribacteria bacterium]